MSRLLWKFLFIYIALYALGVTITIVGVLQYERSQRRAELQRSLVQLSEFAADELPPADDQLETALRTLARKIGARLSIITAEGGALADSEEPHQNIPNQRNQPEIAAVTDSPPDSPRRFSLRGDVLFFARPISRSDGGEYLRLGFPWKSQRDALAALRTRLLKLAGLGSLAVVLVTAILVAPLGRRATQLGAGAAAIADGDFSQNIDVTGSDELAVLAKRFDHMRREVAGQIDRLRTNSDRLTIVLGTMIEGVVVVDNRRAILFANRAARSLLEFAIADPIGRPLVEAVRNRAVHESVTEALAADDPRNFELEFGSGNRRTVALQIRRLPGAPSPGALLVLHDVTELRRLENLRQEFVANVSHELKTPLTVIKAYAETLLEGAINDSQNNIAFVRQIAEQAERLHQLILDLLSVARIESGHERFDLAPVGVRNLVAACLERYAPAAEAKSVRLEQEPGMDGLSVFADEEGFREILDNLVDNAIKYTPQGGRVRVSWRPDDSMVCIEVADTGIGIPPDHQSRIFERFYRVDKARSRELGGTGLGLSIVKHLVSAFGGNVVVQSQLNVGTTFTVRLPRG